MSSGNIWSLSILESWWHSSLHRTRMKSNLAFGTRICWRILQEVTGCLYFSARWSLSPAEHYVSPVYLLARVIQTLHLLSLWHFQEAYTHNLQVYRRYLRNFIRGDKTRSAPLLHIQLSSCAICHLARIQELINADKPSSWPVSIFKRRCTARKWVTPKHRT
jgi:hypothetical protein